MKKYLRTLLAALALLATGGCTAPNGSGDEVSRCRRTCGRVGGRHRVLPARPR